LINQELPIVLVHGLWFRARFMRMLGRRLEDAGFDVLPFNYSTTRQPIIDSAAALGAFCAARVPDGEHLVGHSLGCLLILQLLHECNWSAPGRVLFLGTPLQGSAVARRTRQWPGMGKLFGHADEPLAGGWRHWPEDREVGMIAGDRAFGLGVFTGGLERPNDGTVSVAETRHPGIADHRVLPVTHTGMVFSAPVAKAAVRFLRSGRFTDG
jgi:pimeloyl-ACP methyl ester carboxylesterase